MYSQHLHFYLDCCIIGQDFNISVSGRRLAFHVHSQDSPEILVSFVPSFVRRYYTEFVVRINNSPASLADFITY